MLFRYPISLVLAKLVSNLLIIGIVLASASEGEIKCKKRNLMLNQVAECCVKRLVANHNHFVTQGISSADKCIPVMDSLQGTS
jgi:hypothetical protein